MPPKKTQHPALLLTQSGDVTPTTISAAGPLTLKAIQIQFKSKEIACAGAYKAKPHMLHLFGVTEEGAPDAQNQHQLPPPYDVATFYGDIILVACKVEDKTFDAPVPFKPEDYEEFYTKMFDGGYESEGAEAEEPEEEVADAEEGVEEEEAEAKEFVEEEEAEEEDEEEEAEEEGEEEDAPRPVKVKAPKKKKAVSKSAVLAGTGSAYPNAPILSEDEQLQETPAGEPTGELPPPRQRILARLETIFSEHLNAAAIRDLERCIYNGAIHQAKARHVARSWTYPLFNRVYTMHALHIVSNFHPSSYVGNTELFEQFKRGDLSFDALATMNTYELHPSLWREMFEARAVREKKQLEGNRDRATDQFLCTRCWKRECTYYEMQTRSADEPMTIFITCLNCGKKWRQ
jgi:DNA-directed RNA polymerase subunit M/transcription elongation factor TFIIS